MRNADLRNETANTGPPSYYDEDKKLQWLSTCSFILIPFTEIVSHRQGSDNTGITHSAGKYLCSPESDSRTTTKT